MPVFEVACTGDFAPFIASCASELRSRECNHIDGMILGAEAIFGHFPGHSGVSRAGMIRKA
jgi:hypothetical protein